jgi:hypothetical protein
VRVRVRVRAGLRVRLRVRLQSSEQLLHGGHSE